MSESTANAPSPTALPASPAPAPGAAGPSWRRRVLFLGVGGVVVLLVASVSLWYVLRDGDGETGCAADRRRVPAETAPAFMFRMPTCFQPAGSEIVADLTDPPALQQQLAVVVPLTGGDADNIIVIEARDAFRDTSAQSDTEIEEQLRAADEMAGFPTDTYQRRTVDGARGWGAPVALSTGGQSDSWVFYKGSRKVNVSCSWNQETTKDRILTGCAQILDTLTIA